MHLSRQAIDTMKFNPEGPAKQIVWDDAPKGLGVRIHPNGTKSYVLLCRIGRGRQAQQRLGVLEHCDRITLTEARDRATKKLAQAREGVDPFAAVYHGEDGPTMTDLYRRYMADHGSHKKSASDLVAQWEQHVLPGLGAKTPVARVEMKDTLRVYTKLKATAPYRANRVLSLMHSAFELAELWGWRSGTNPARIPRNLKFKERRRKFTATVEQLAAIGAELSRANYTVAQVIRVLMYTGARLNEILPLRWGRHEREPWLDAERRRVVLPESKTSEHVGERTILLNDPAWEIIAGMPRVPGNPYVFPGKDEGQPLKWIQKAWEKIRNRAGVPDVQIRDLRHNLAGYMIQHAPITAVRDQLGHTSVQTTNIYIDPLAESVREGSNKAAAEIQHALIGAQPQVGGIGFVH